MKIYGVKIEKSLFDRLCRHMALLTVSQRETETKQSWVLDAIERKLEKEESTSSPYQSKMRAIQVSVPEEVSNRLNRKIEEAKADSGTFSFKRFFVEAVEEKLQAEAGSTEKDAISNLSRQREEH